MVVIFVVTALIQPIWALIVGVFICLMVWQRYFFKRTIDAKTREIAAKEKYYRTLFETSTDAVVVLDAAGKVLYQTPSTERILGYSLPEAQSLNGTGLLHPDEGEELRSAFFSLVSGQGKELRNQHRIKHKNGSYIWISCTYRNLLHDENVSAIILNYSDITDLVNVEHEKDAAQHMLKERIKELSIIYYLNEILKEDSQSTDEVFNKVVALLPSAWQFPEICVARIHFDGADYVSGRYAATSDRNAQRTEFTLIDGRKGFIEVVYTEHKPDDFEGPFLKEERDLIGILAETITVYFNKKVSWDKLIKSEANLKTVFGTAQVGFLLLDRNYHVVAFNEQMQRAYKAATSIGLLEMVNFIDLVVPDRKQGFRDTLESVMANGVPHSYETSYINSGATTFYDIDLVPVMAEGQAIGACLIAHEITHRKNMERERLKMIDDLVQRNNNLEQFAHIVSHNVRAPLSTILGLTSLVKDCESDEERQIALDGLVLSGKQLDKVIRDLNETLRTGDDLSVKNGN